MASTKEAVVLFDGIGYKSAEELAIAESDARYRPHPSYAEKGDTVDLPPSEFKRLEALGAVRAAGDDDPVPAEPELTDPAGNPSNVTDAGDAGDGGLKSLGRPELNERATAAGVENPESLPNKQAVLDAIAAAQPPSE